MSTKIVGLCFAQRSGCGEHPESFAAGSTDRDAAHSARAAFEYGRGIESVGIETVVNIVERFAEYI